MTTTPLRNLAPGIRASLEAKLEALLAKPIIAYIGDAAPGREVDDDDAPSSGVFRVLRTAARAYVPVAPTEDPWRESARDKTYTVRISLDYEDLWRGCEKKVSQAFESCIESKVTFLTDAQKILLERSPREFLALFPLPESAELLAFEKQTIGGSTRVVTLTLASAPESPAHVHHIAIVPNLTQIQRQLDGLRVIEHESDDGRLAPLRALLGLCDVDCLVTPPTALEADGVLAGERRDQHQAACIDKAVSTPHFAVIQGPPGSGKTTVISSVIRRAIARGETVLVVSPTHVAVDNVVEKLVPGATTESPDRLEAHTLPVRYAAREKKLSTAAREYWVGAKKQLRAASISRRIERRLTETIPFAQALYAMEDANAAGYAPLTSAVARVERVICGTPIGILSLPSVKNAAPGSFDLLVVDEVSKMTLPEFLAVAVKARRWVLVGDPEQLPPFNDCAENATVLDDVIDPQLELVGSVASVVETAKYGIRDGGRLVVVASDPPGMTAAIRAHLRAVMPNDFPGVMLFDDALSAGIVVCSQQQVDEACATPAWLLVERGVKVARPTFASGARFVDAQDRAQAKIFQSAFNTYHAQPWCVRSGQKLKFVEARNQVRNYLPSTVAIEVLTEGDATEMSAAEERAELVEDIAERFAINVISVYDWLTGIPVAHFDTSPLRELGALWSARLRDAVQPFVGTLQNQYRMHSSLSQVPRELFYFGEALHNGMPDKERGCLVELVQAQPDANEQESNANEREAICALLRQLNASGEAKENAAASIMVITPYGSQERLLSGAIKDMTATGEVSGLQVEVCTLDRCQGREADYVFISLVSSRPSDFMNMPKRWNVAITRAKSGLFLVGDINAYRNAARNARHWQRTNRGAAPTMSVLARIIEAYDGQIAARGRRVAR
jgi:hypothetical protein